MCFERCPRCASNRRWPAQIARSECDLSFVNPHLRSHSPATQLRQHGSSQTLTYPIVLPLTSAAWNRPRMLARPALIKPRVNPSHKPPSPIAKLSIAVRRLRGGPLRNERYWPSCHKWMPELRWASPSQTSGDAGQTLRAPYRCTGRSSAESIGPTALQ